MKNFLAYDSPVSQFLYKVCICCCLNALWILFSIPIFTIGASTTALYAVSVKLMRDSEGAVYKQFVRSFKQNFKQATQLWLILLTLGIFLGVDAYVLYHLRQATTGTMAIFWTILFAVIIAASIVYAILLAYTFPLLSYFDNTNTAMLLNAFRVGVQYLFVTLIIFGIHFLVAYITINIFTPLAMFGMGLCAMGSSFFLSNVFYSLSGETKPSKKGDTTDADDEEEAE